MTFLDKAINNTRSFYIIGQSSALVWGLVGENPWLHKVSDSDTFLATDLSSMLSP